MLFFMVEVYMHPPPGVDASSGHVCRFQRALYGLKQAPRACLRDSIL
jgi:hypothetical protein